jgi:hypothetical protein
MPRVPFVRDTEAHKVNVDAEDLAALSKRSWREPLDWPTFRSGAPQKGRSALEATWDEKAEAYKRSKPPGQ